MKFIFTLCLVMIYLGIYNCKRVENLQKRLHVETREELKCFVYEVHVATVPIHEQGNSDSHSIGFIEFGHMFHVGVCEERVVGPMIENWCRVQMMQSGVEIHGYILFDVENYESCDVAAHDGEVESDGDNLEGDGAGDVSSGGSQSSESSESSPAQVVEEAPEDITILFGKPRRQWECNGMMRIHPTVKEKLWNVWQDAKNRQIDGHTGDNLNVRRVGNHCSRFTCAKIKTRLDYYNELVGRRDTDTDAAETLDVWFASGNGRNTKRLKMGTHEYGCAIDIDSSKNPYMYGESGDGRQYAAHSLLIYKRISWLMLEKPTIVPALSKVGGFTIKLENDKYIPTTENRRTRDKGIFYEAMKQESDALVSYFDLMRNSHSQQLTEKYTLMSSEDFTQALTSSGNGELFSGIESEADLKAKIAQDYFDLKVKRRSNAARKRACYDFDGEHSLAFYDQLVQDNKLTENWRDWPSNFDPVFINRNVFDGWLNIDKRLWLALEEEEFDFGAMDWGRASGDIMHFDMGCTKRGGTTHRYKYREVLLHWHKSCTGSNAILPAGTSDDDAVTQLINAVAPSRYICPRFDAAGCDL